MSAFEVHCKKIVDDYVQTVLIIDDGACLDHSRNSNPVTGDLQAPQIANPTAMMLTPPTTEKLEKEEQKDSSEKKPHLIDTLALTSAFYERGIVAGLYQPQIEKGQDPKEFAEKAMEVSSTADVLILDWMLNGSDSTYSNEIVKQILAHDKSNGGRLRTIVVYTGETNLHKLRDDLWDYLGDESLNKLTDFQINSEHLNIVFYNKLEAIAAIRPVSEKDLPDKALMDFAVLVDGLVPAFAMKAAATIRRNTGKIVKRFGSGLDVGYLSHRVLLPNPSDSEVFMMEHFVSYIRSVLAISQVDRQTLGEQTVSDWVEHNAEKLSKNISFNDKDYPISLAGVKDLAKNGFENNLARVIQNNTDDTISGSFIDSQKPCFEQAISIFDIKNGVCSTKSSIALSILASFRRTFEDVGGFQKPYLTQGSLVYSVNKNEFLLCVTPKCDTARVDDSETFSFAVLERKLLNKKFDLIVPLMSEVVDYIKKPLTDELSSIACEIVEFQLNSNEKPKRFGAHDRIDEINELLNFNGVIGLSTSDKFYKLTHINFSSDQNRRVNPNITECGNLAFWDDDVNEYIWIGDLEDLDSQKRVSKLVGNLNRIGNDEVEWLRRRYS
ncbi:TPA: response regulator receiver domain [Vibrio parahaemolyticus]